MEFRRCRVGVLAISPFPKDLAPTVLELLAVGGGFYSLGVTFHGMERLPYQNAIWHGLVLIAATVHFVAVADLVST